MTIRDVSDALQAAAQSAQAASAPVKTVLGSGGATGVVSILAHSAVLGWVSILLTLLGVFGVWYFNGAAHRLALRRMEIEEEQAVMRRAEHEARMEALRSRRLDGTESTSPSPLDGAPANGHPPSGHHA